jgi:hypothetical protein
MRTGMMTKKPTPMAHTTFEGVSPDPAIFADAWLPIVSLKDASHVVRPGFALPAVDNPEGRL